MTVAAKPLPFVDGTTKERLRLWLRLLRTTRAVEGELRERLRTEFATTLPRFDVMAALVRCEHGMTMTALSRHLLVSNGNVTGIVERLVADGLVQRVADSGDRRTTFVRLSEFGLEQFAVMASAHAAWVEELLGALAPEEVATLHGLLAKASLSTEGEL